VQGINKIIPTTVIQNSGHNEFGKIFFTNSSASDISGVILSEK
jgi:hypothetical protein